MKLLCSAKAGSFSNNMYQRNTFLKDQLMHFILKLHLYNGTSSGRVHTTATQTETQPHAQIKLWRRQQGGH
jgi:cystathionine beta-lyase/cystathionine gamma-synthase